LSSRDPGVASLKFATGRPSWVRRISGSAPRLPIKITLLTLPAMSCSVRSRYHQSSIANLVPVRPAARAIDAGWPLSTRLRAAPPVQMRVLILFSQRRQAETAPRRQSTAIHHNPADSAGLLLFCTIQRLTEPLYYRPHI